MTDNLEAVDSGALLEHPATVPLQNADHAMGVELQIVELVEQQARARVQHRDGDAASFEGEIAELRTELAATADPTFPANESPFA